MNKTTETMADRIRKRITMMDSHIPKLQAEAAMLRKIAGDLITKADDLDETVAYQIKEQEKDRAYLAKLEAES